MHPGSTPAADAWQTTLVMLLAAIAAAWTGMSWVSPAEESDPGSRRDETRPGEARPDDTRPGDAPRGGARHG